MARKRRKQKGGPTAATADRHRLYEQSVQDPPAEIDFLEMAYKTHRGRSPRTLREDFCGTAFACAEFVSRDPERTAVGLDLDDEVLAWGQENNIDPLGDAARRVTLLKKNVLDGVEERVDLAIAMNFSYFIFKKRRDLVKYFARVREGLDGEGVFAMDCYGGWEAQEPQEEEREVEWDEGDFWYIWDQDSYNPIDSSVVNHIHFKFQDGTKMTRAFTYEWRLWQLAELREALEEAGYSDVRTWFEKEDEDGDGIGEWEEQTEIENDPGWLCYITAAV